MALGLWNQQDIPHKGWRIVDENDLEDQTQICEMCRAQAVRYAFTMAHDDYDGSLIVGCNCAEKMTDDYTTPRQREARLIKRAGSRSRWIKSPKWKISMNGNPYIKHEGKLLTIFATERGYKFACGKEFYGPFRSLDKAKGAAFDYLNE